MQPYMVGYPSVNRHKQRQEAQHLYNAPKGRVLAWLALTVVDNLHGYLDFVIRLGVGAHTARNRYDVLLFFLGHDINNFPYKYRQKPTSNQIRAGKLWQRT